MSFTPRDRPPTSRYERAERRCRSAVAGSISEASGFVDPGKRSVEIWRRTPIPPFTLAGTSGLLAVDATDLVAAIDWPEA